MYQEWIKKYEKLIKPQEKILKDEIFEKTMQISIRR